MREVEIRNAFITVPDVRYLDKRSAQTSTLNIRVTDHPVSKIAVESRFEGVCAAVLPYTKGGLIPAEAVTPNTIVILRDDDMIVIPRVSQLGVHISTTVDSTPSTFYRYGSYQKKIGVYPMCG